MAAAGWANSSDETMFFQFLKIPFHSAPSQASRSLKVSLRRSGKLCECRKNNFLWLFHSFFHSFFHSSDNAIPIKSRMAVLQQERATLSPSDSARKPVCANGQISSRPIPWRGQARTPKNRYRSQASHSHSRLMSKRLHPHEGRHLRLRGRNRGIHKRILCEGSPFATSE